MIFRLFFFSIKLKDEHLIKEGTLICVSKKEDSLRFNFNIKGFFSKKYHPFIIKNTNKNLCVHNFFLNHRSGYQFCDIIVLFFLHRFGICVKGSFVPQFFFFFFAIDLIF